MPGEQVRVPVQVRDVGEAIAFDLDLRYDPGVLAARQVEAGDATSSFSLASNVREPGRARIARFDAHPVRWRGDLVAVTFEVVGRSGARTALTLASPLLNEGRIGVSVKDGSPLVRSGR